MYVQAPQVMQKNGRLKSWLHPRWRSKQKDLRYLQKKENGTQPTFYLQPTYAPTNIERTCDELKMKREKS